MEKKFYSDNFEQLLKESTDNFRMYPSKRVWHSIYNDLHPGRRWPSLAVLLLLISSIVFIGLSNKSRVGLRGTNAKISSPGIKESSTIASVQHSNIISGADHINNPEVLQNSDDINSNTSITKTNQYNNKKETDQQFAGLTIQGRNTSTQINSTAINMADVNDNDTRSNTLNNDVTNELQRRVISTIGINNFMNDEKETANLMAPVVKKVDVKTQNKLSVADKTNTSTDKEWIEDYAFHNKPSLSKWKTRVKYQLYFTPSVGYRILSKNTNFNPVNNAFVAPSGNVQNYKAALTQSAAVNIEIGGNFLYAISKKINLKAGVQLNYTNYGINAYELKHPTTTTLTLTDPNNGLPILRPMSSTLANIPGVSSKRLNNNTYQISLPLGADIKLAGNNNLKWYAGASIQPTYIADGHSYLISTDLKNYVTDNSLMNNWNLNAGVETFISYKTNGGIILNVGPQLRYQLFSTYNKQYIYTEKLYNLGVKIGITTRF